MNNLLNKWLENSPCILYFVPGHNVYCKLHIKNCDAEMIKGKESTCVYTIV